MVLLLQKRPVGGASKNRFPMLLRAFQSPTQLNLKNKQVNTEEIHLLCNFSKQNWESLWLAGNHISDENSALVFSKLVSHCTGVKLLDLRRNELSDFGLEPLLHFLSAQKNTLRVLYLSENLISDQGYARILNVLEEGAIEIFTTSAQAVPKPVFQSILKCPRLIRLSVDDKMEAQDQRAVEHCVQVNKSHFIANMMVLMSAKQIKRVSTRSAIGKLPQELLHMVATCLH